MKSWFIALALSLFAAHANSETFSIPDVGVSFEAPLGYTKLDAAEIAIKYPSNRAPAFVVGNARRTTSIAYDLKPNGFPADKIGEVKEFFEKTFDRVVPGIDWKQRKLIDMLGQQWIYLEMSSRAIDTDIHNIMLVTPLQGKMLIFNFNSTKDEFPKVEAELRESIKSISLKSR
jgi:hypothetical protein